MLDKHDWIDILWVDFGDEVVNLVLCLLLLFVEAVPQVVDTVEVAIPSGLRLPWDRRWPFSPW